MTIDKLSEKEQEMLANVAGKAAAFAMIKATAEILEKRKTKIEINLDEDIVADSVTAALSTIDKDAFTSGDMMPPGGGGLKSPDQGKPKKKKPKKKPDDEEDEKFEKADPATVQTLIFDKGRFKDAAAAKSWASSHGFHAAKVDETENSFRLRQKNPGGFQEGSFRTLSLTDGVKAVIGRLKKIASTDCLDCMIPISGKELPFVVHAHWIGLKKSQSEMSMEDLLKEPNPGDDFELSYDFRLSTDKFDGYWGWKVAGVGCGAWIAGEEIGATLKEPGKSHWIDIAKNEPLVISDGASPPRYSKIFEIDRGGWWPGITTPTSVRFNMRGKTVYGEYVFKKKTNSGWTLVPQKKMFVEPDLESVKKQLQDDGHRWLLWPKSGWGNGLTRIEIEPIEDETKYSILKSRGDRKYTLGIAYPAGQLDAHSDTITADQLEEAAWNYMRKNRRIGVGHRHGTDGSGEVVESYIHRAGPVEVDGQRINTGDWLLGVVWSDNAWSEIKKGTLTGFSIQGWAKKNSI